MKSLKVVIIGGVAGGASTAARLRRNDEHLEIIMFERGSYISFANCGLPYYIGGVITEKSALLLQTPQSFKARFNVDVRINSDVTCVDTQNKTIVVENIETGESYSESYDKLVLSPGAKPVMPNVDGINKVDDGIFSLRNIPNTLEIVDYIKKHNVSSATVIGGGFIGLETAENLIQLGISTQLIESANQILSPIDRDMAAEVHPYIKSKGLSLLLDHKLVKVEKIGGKFKLTLQNNNENRIVETGMVIMATGVTPDTEFLHSSDIKLNDRGSIVVDEYMKTSDENVYAAGDAVTTRDFVTKTDEFIPLAGPANKQGRIVADNICGKNVSYNGTQGSSIIKLFDLTVASTGINEKQAILNNIDHEVILGYSASHAAYYPGGSGISIKALFEKPSGKLIGAQLVGLDGVDKRCDILATVIRLGGTYKDLTQLELCYAPPYGSAKDPVNMVGYIAENTFAGSVKNFNWHEVDSLPRDGSLNLVDVRTGVETARGMIDGFIHIPLDELRQNLNKIDKNKPVYVHCQSGLRSYVACRILTQNGFDCYNLIGGYRFYNLVTQDIRNY